MTNHAPGECSCEFPETPPAERFQMEIQLTLRRVDNRGYSGSDYFNLSERVTLGHKSLREMLALMADLEHSLRAHVDPGGTGGT